MKHTIIATAISTALLFTATLQAAKADTWVFKDMQRPNGHERSMAAKRADARKCGADRSGRSFSDARAPDMQSCMFAFGWALDHVIPDPPSRQARASVAKDTSPSPQIDNSSNDDWVQRQQDQDNLQQMLNTQQMINDQQRVNDQMMQDQTQQMINMNNQ
jgi:uncharacterized low-complexity protein